MAKKLLQTAEARRRRARYRAKKKKTGGGFKIKALGDWVKKFAPRDKSGRIKSRRQLREESWAKFRPTNPGLSKAVIASAKAAAKAGRTTLPPTAVKAINAKIRAAKKSGSGLGDSIRTSQTAFRGNPMAQKLNSAGLGGAAKKLHFSMALK